MDTSHHLALLAGYATAMIGWMAFRPAIPQLWPARGLADFPRPWLEFAWAIAAVAGVVGLGQLYQRGWRLPVAGPLGPAREAVNQVLLFSPMILLLVVRRQPLSTAWVPTRHIAARLGVGTVLALAALVAFALARGSLARWPDLVASVYRPSHVTYAVQIALEDLTIAIIFVRLAAGLRRQWLAAVIVAALFAAGHVPATLASGAPLRELVPLVLDAALGIGIILVLSRSADIWWFWCVHFAMDMTQFLDA